VSPPWVNDRGWTSWPQGWKAWRHKDKLAENVHVRVVEERHTAHTPENGHLHTEGETSGCFACASTPGRVWMESPNGEGLMPVPCPSCAKKGEEA
jgi:hypothetical protein